MTQARELVMYTRTTGCAFVTTAKKVLTAHDVPYREIFIDKDPEAKQRVLDWTGFLSVPTLIIANTDEDLPFEDATPLEKGVSPRGVDRGVMLTEGSTSEVEAWLRKHRLIST